jgi:hypothetical protein
MKFVLDAGYATLPAEQASLQLIIAVCIVGMRWHPGEFLHSEVHSTICPSAHTGVREDVDPPGEGNK